MSDTPLKLTHLVGESNPYGDDPAFALYPAPDGCAGWQLCKHLGLTRAEYLRRFERRNLLTAAKWSAPATRAAADELLVLHPPGHRLVLLGAKVAAAFGVDFKSNLCMPRFMEIGTKVLRGRRVLVLPHPSRRSCLWDEVGMIDRARGAMNLLEEGAHVNPHLHRLEDVR